MAVDPAVLDELQGPGLISLLDSPGPTNLFSRRFLLITKEQLRDALSPFGKLSIAIADCTAEESDAILQEHVKGFTSPYQLP